MGIFEVAGAESGACAKVDVCVRRGSAVGLSPGSRSVFLCFEAREPCKILEAMVASWMTFPSGTT